jgi:hypothetical protein
MEQAGQQPGEADHHGQQQQHDEQGDDAAVGFAVSVSGPYDLG